VLQVGDNVLKAPLEHARYGHRFCEWERLKSEILKSQFYASKFR
jgi:hypothetical protein